MVSQYQQEQRVKHDGTIAAMHNNEMPCPGYKLNSEAAHQRYIKTGPTSGEHNYDEPYFEPASEFDTLLEQLKELAVTNIQEESLKSVETT